VGFIARCQTDIANAALLAAASVEHKKLPGAFAKFLGFTADIQKNWGAVDLCDGDMILEMQQLPPELRKFDFQSATPNGPVSKGRGGQNRVRHGWSNYDSMLRATGRFVPEEQYAVLRKGVDRLVKKEIGEAINRAINGARRP
jgi:hypothetical protein